jgi:signal transduction histidine kinase
MRKQPNSLNTFLFTFLKFLLPIGIFFTISFISFREDIIDLEKEYLLKAGNGVVNFLSHDEDLSDNYYFISDDYIFLIVDQQGNIVSSNKKANLLRDIEFLKDIKPVSEVQNVKNYLVYANNFKRDGSYYKVVLAISEENVEKRIKLLLFSSIFASLATTVVITFLSLLDIKTHLREYELYSKKLKEVALYLSHEIKTPLSILLMNIQYIKTNDDVKNAIERATKRILKLMRNLKILSETELKPKSFTLINIKGLIDEFINFYGANLQVKNLAVNVQSMPIVKVYSDYELLYTLFLNLFDNAVKYAKENTEIRVNWQMQDKRLKMFIVNETEHKIFEEESFGLGLIIVEEIAKKLDIKVNFIRDGSLFTAIVDMEVYEVEE